MMSMPTLARCCNQNHSRLRKPYPHRRTPPSLPPIRRHTGGCMCPSSKRRRRSKSIRTPPRMSNHSRHRSASSDRRIARPLSLPRPPQHRLRIPACTAKGRPRMGSRAARSAYICTLARCGNRNHSRLREPYSRRRTARSLQACHLRTPPQHTRQSRLLLPPSM